jgi:hypothetical protein
MARDSFRRIAGRNAGPAWVLFVAAAIAACSSAYGEEPAAPAPPTCALDCGAHGKCSGTGNEARCTCEPGAAGPDCRSCAAGFAHDPKTGTCVSRCALTACGPHETCRIEKGEPLCACNAGYTKASTACAWSGGPLDPSFENKPPGAWKLEGGASLEATGKGGVSPGLAMFSASCEGRVSQTFVMPAFADAEPLALEVSSYCTEGFLGLGCTFAAYELGVSGRFDSPVLSPGAGGDFRLARFCLGERAFGGKVSLSFTPSCGGGFDDRRGLDHAAIVPATACPAPGTIPNGNFDGTGGWEAAGADGAGAEVLVGGGTAGSRAGHLFASKRCVDASLTTTFSVPSSSLNRPAMTMTVKGSNATSMTVVAAGTTLATVSGTGVFEKVSVCLPQWSRGLAIPLSLHVSGGSGVCSVVIPTIDFLVDDLAIVSEPACPEPGLVIDGDFERKTSANPWMARLQGATLSFAGGAGAHGGTGYARLSGNATCDESSLSQSITVPDAVPGAGGPQLRFWYQGTGTEARFRGADDILPATTGWTQHTKCLAPTSAGHHVPFSIYFQAGGAACAYPTLLLDDVDVVHAKSCPE